MITERTKLNLRKMTKNLDRKNKPKFTLIGAGPGAVDLITLRGVNALKSADVVLYDALIDTDLLEFAPTAKHIFVGKRKGYKRFTQEEINDQIVNYAFTQGNVVRLKGGDSFVFGRGAEEIEHASAFDIEIEIIPGISSSIAAPASAGIPVTHRNVARGFWVLTGTASKGLLNQDIYLAAQSSATIVILMGMSKLAEISDIFKSHGKQDLPVSIIQNATKVNEKIGVGSVSTICKVVEKEGLKNPAVIVLGEVVENSFKFKDYFQNLNKEYQPYGRA